MLLKEEVSKVVAEILVDDLPGAIRKEAVRLLDTGAIELLNYEDRRYVLAKMLIMVAMENVASEFRLSKANETDKRVLSDIVNLRNF